MSPARAPAGHAGPSGGLLALNAGSSSLKFALFDAAAPDGEARLRGQVEGLGGAAHLIARDAADHTAAEHHWPAERQVTHEDVLPKILDLARQAAGAGGVAAIGHRIVHGGREFTAPVRIDARVLEALDALCPLAPLHQPHNLAAVRAAMKAQPGVPQVACFDTAFHATQPAVATRLALTRELEDEGVRRYGFHGLSYEYIARRLGQIDPELAAGRVIAAHLGSGASLCAMAGGRSVDTTMGFTAVDGLVMGTRCGTTDPGAIIYLIQALGWTAEQVEDLIWRRAGLLGMSGLSSDMRELTAGDAPQPAREAVELFVWRLAREAGGLASSLGGLDGLVFTAGIGEHSPEIRAAACARLAWLGVELDPAANEAGAEAGVISTPASRVTVRVIPTDEERMIAIHTAAVVG